MKLLALLITVVADVIAALVEVVMKKEAAARKSQKM